MRNRLESNVQRCNLGGSRCFELVTYFVVLQRCSFDRYKRVHGERLGVLRHTMGVLLEDVVKSLVKLGTHLEASQIRLTRSASDSPSPRIPPEQTLIPASLT